MSNSLDDYRIPEVVQPHPISKFNIDSVEKNVLIGAGGDAEVYSATTETDGKTHKVAIKEPRIQGTIHNHVQKRFETEAETWSSLSDHKNIVTVYDWGANPLPWLCLEYMDGGTLEAKIGSINLAEALWLSGRIADGIHYGHRHGVAHLDIKPTNILLRSTSEGMWDYPKISDWGLAKMLLENSKSIDVEGISPTYGAPEQFDTDKFGKTDDITDIYQLGSLVYVLTTGEPPFSGSSREIMQGVLAKDPNPPSNVNSSIPTEVDEVILKALSKSKSERYDGILAFKKKIDRLFRELSADEPENQTFKNISNHTHEKRKEPIESKEMINTNPRDTQFNHDDFVINKSITLSDYIEKVDNYNKIEFRGLNEAISKMTNDKTLSKKIQDASSLNN